MGEFTPKIKLNLKSMSEPKNLEKQLTDEPKLSGIKVKVCNPEDGADIYAEKHMFGKTFELKRGQCKVMDKTIADSALYLWQFLKGERVDGEIMEKEEPVQEEQPKDEIKGFDGYSLEDMRNIARLVGIKGGHFTGLEKLKLKLSAVPEEEISRAVNSLGLPDFII